MSIFARRSDASIGRLFSRLTPHSLGRVSPMKRILFVVLALAPWCDRNAVAQEPAAQAPVAAAPAEQPAAVEQPAAPAPHPAVAEIQKSIDAYVAAFNAGDAAKLASLFSEQGEMFAPDGERTQGREAVEKQMAEYFASAKDAKLELADTQIDVQSPSTAVETGLARVITPGEEPSETEYRAIHVKTADGWRIDSVVEVEATPPPPSNLDKLQGLAWLVGDWGDDSEETQIESSVRWSRNENFLIQSYRILTPGGEVDFEGTQVIGWDPRAETIRSWLFDSDGGFGVGRWTNDGNRWTVQSLQTLPDGRAGSATNVYELVDDNTINYRSLGRQVEGELLPNIGPVTVVRKN
jgi:uncharacterized protein (TIGR02246 family)